MTPLEHQALDAFRKHRHDILNGLQLVKAHIQLNKPDNALRAVDNLANWLSTLSHLQAHPYGWRLVWLAAGYSNVRMEVRSLSREVTDSMVEELTSVVSAVDEFAVTTYGDVIRAEVSSGSGSECAMQVTIYLRKEFIESWHTVHNGRSWRSVVVHVLSY